MARSEARVCTRCILPETFPGISFNERGECNLCREVVSPAMAEAHRAALRRSMEEVIASAKGKAAYECVVAFSGGKDSSYTLKLLVEHYGLRCVAVTIDNGFMSEQARSNCLAVTGALGVDFTMFRPAPRFMRQLYGQSVRNRDIHAPASVRRASNMCSSCISLINAEMVKIAVQNQSPLIAGGYIGGQVPKDGVILRVDLSVLAATRATAYERYVQYFGAEADRYFQVPDAADYGGRSRITIINPMLTVRLREEQIVDELGALGWRRPADTGRNSTNCRLNDLGILVHYRQYGFNPYVFEMAEQVRNGLMDRETALGRAKAIPDFQAVSAQAQQIGLDIGEIG